MDQMLGLIKIVIKKILIKKFNRNLKCFWTKYFILFFNCILNHNFYQKKIPKVCSLFQLDLALKSTSKQTVIGCFS